MTNAVKYILRKQPSEIIINIIDNAPGICPLYVLTGYGMSKRCKNSACKRCAIAWLSKEEEKEIKRGMHEKS